MPYGDPDRSDPNVLVGVELPASDDTLVDMAYAFAEELARAGHSERRIVALFRSPFYAGSHAAWRGLGEERVRQIVAESYDAFGRVRVTVHDVAGADNGEE